METQSIIAQIDAEIGRLQQVRAILTGTGTNGRKNKIAAKSAPKKRQLSPEARARIGAAQKARWAKDVRIDRMDNSPLRNGRAH